MPEPQYEILALRYAHLAERTQRDVLTFPEDHDAPMPLDFFVWAIRGEGRVIVLTPGCRRERARGRNGCARRSTRCGRPASTPTVEDVVLSHMHWDHAAGPSSRRRLPLQDAEMAYAPPVHVPGNSSVFESST
jgi:glyoxylase-like metal-dependent hydrolase (beta-lactamase superfamily II)